MEVKINLSDQVKDPEIIKVKVTKMVKNLCEKYRFYSIELSLIPLQISFSISQGLTSIAKAILYSSVTLNLVLGLLDNSFNLVVLIPVFLATSDRLIDLLDKYNPSSFIIIFLGI